MHKHQTIAFSASTLSFSTRHRAMRHRLVTIALAGFDAAVFLAADLIFRIGRHVPELVLFPGRIAGGFALDAFALLGGLFVFVRYLAGDYSKRAPFWYTTKHSTSALLLIASLNLFLVALTGQVDALIPNILVWLLLLIAIPLTRLSAKKALNFLGLWQIPAILIGDGGQIREVVRTLDQSIDLGFRVGHIVLTDECEPGDLPAGRRVSAVTEPAAIARLATNTGCSQAVLAMEDLPRMSEIMLFLIGQNFDVTIISPIRRLPLVFGMSASEFFGRDIVLLQTRSNLARIPSRAIKRLIDIAAASLLLVMLFPAFVILFFMIKADDPGPAFFVQARLGRWGRLFPCVKFRTMRVDAEIVMQSWEQDHPELIEKYRANNFKLVDDPRVTKVGRWLRRTSLDELPQLFNVLVGEMSLAGPRPLLPREMPFYGAAIELYQKVRPGITGLWQISGRSNTTFRDRVMFDEWYIKNWSVWYDIVILVRTVFVVFSRNSGAH